MSRSQVFMLLLLSIVFGLGAVFMAKQWMNNQTQPEVKMESIERHPVVVAAIDIPAGTVIQVKHLTNKLLEKDWHGDAYFRETTELVGQIASVSMYKDEIVHLARIAKPGEGATLAALIPEDMRAVTIRVNDVIGVAGFLLPGNKVDVLNTVTSGKNYANTLTILKDIKVLAVDQTARTNDNKPVIVRAVTLEVSPKNAEKLLTAKSKGSIQLSLRNPHAIEPKIVKRRYVAPPSVTIIKGTQSTNVRVKD